MANTTIPIELSSTPGIVDNSNATAITIDSSENVGIGSKAYIKSDANVGYFGGDAAQTNHISFYDALDLVRIYTAGTERMRIDSSGNVGIGTSSPSEKLQVEGNARLADAGSIQFGSSKYQTLTGQAGSNDLLYRTYANHIFKTTTGPTDNTDGAERMRINSVGAVGMLRTPDTTHTLSVQALSGQRCALWSINNSGLGHVTINQSGTATYDAWAFTTNNGGTQTGGIVVNSTTTNFNTSSDERLKENIVNADSQLETIKNIQIREFDWKTTNEHDIGVIAQELENVYPSAVTVGGEDEHKKPYSVDYSKLVAPLIKAVQEQQALIESLTARITALES